MAITYNQLMLVGTLLEQLQFVNHHTTEPLISATLGLYKLAKTLDENTRTINQYIIEKSIQDLDINTLRQFFLSQGISKEQITKIKEQYYSKPVEVSGVPLQIGPFTLTKKVVNLFKDTSSLETKAVLYDALKAKTDQIRATILFDYVLESNNQNRGFCKELVCTFFKSHNLENKGNEDDFVEIPIEEISSTVKNNMCC